MLICQKIRCLQIVLDAARKIVQDNGSLQGDRVTVEQAVEVLGISCAGLADSTQAELQSLAQTAADSSGSLDTQLLPLILTRVLVIFLRAHNSKDTLP